MALNRDNFYEFVTEWRIAGTCGEIADVFRDPLELPRWWPAVYLHVEELQPPEDRIYEVTTAGSTDAVQPVYDTTIGDTTTDGTAVRSPIPAHSTSPSSCPGTSCPRRIEP